MVKPEAARKLPPRKRIGSTTTSTNVLRAKALEIIAAGGTVDAAAKAVGRSSDTVRDWQRAIAPAVEARLAAVTGGIIDGAVEAKRRVRDAAPEAAELILKILRADSSLESSIIVGRGDDTRTETALDPQLLRVRLQAALALLDRGGVPPRSETELAGTVTTHHTGPTPAEAKAEIAKRLEAMSPEERELAERLLAR